MKLIFMGTPDFAVPCLEALIKAGHTVEAVFTQPDKPKGRGYTLTPPPVKVTAMEHGIEVFQPKTLKDGDAFERIKNVAPDAIIVVAFGKLIPENILELPKYGCINVHASLLPKYRGAAPIQWAVLEGESESGVTVMQMDKGLDTGDMLLKAAVPLGQNETYGDLYDRLSPLGAQTLIEALDKLERGEITPEPQGETTTRYAAMIDKAFCKIDWTESCERVHNKVRGLCPMPSAFAVLNGKKVKIFKTKKSELNGKAGEIVSLNPLTVACGEGSVEICELQLEGKKRMDAASFLLGHQLKTSQFFE